MKKKAKASASPKGYLAFLSALARDKALRALLSSSPLCDFAGLQIFASAHGYAIRPEDIRRYSPAELPLIDGADDEYYLSFLVDLERWGEGLAQMSASSADETYVQRMARRLRKVQTHHRHRHLLELDDSPQIPVSGTGTNRLRIDALLVLFVLTVLLLCKQGLDAAADVNGMGGTFFIRFLVTMGAAAGFAYWYLRSKAERTTTMMRNEMHVPKETSDEKHAEPLSQDLSTDAYDKPYSQKYS